MVLDSKIPSGPIDKKWDKAKFDLKLVNPANKRKFEVIVVGSGLAGGSSLRRRASDLVLCGGAARLAGQNGEGSQYMPFGREYWRRPASSQTVQ